ncbi:MAG: hypothetical protein WCK47_15405, partial [bacterium]
MPEPVASDTVKPFLAFPLVRVILTGSCFMSASIIGRRFMWLVGALLLGVNLVVGAKIASRADSTNDTDTVAFEKMQLLTEVMMLIRQNYVDEDKT